MALLRAVMSLVTQSSKINNSLSVDEILQLTQRKVMRRLHDLRCPWRSARLLSLCTRLYIPLRGVEDEFMPPLTRDLSRGFSSSSAFHDAAFTMYRTLLITAAFQREGRSGSRLDVCSPKNAIPHLACNLFPSHIVFQLPCCVYRIRHPSVCR